METFFTILRKGVVTTIALIFAVVVLYTPQDWNNIEHVEAGGGFATEATQWLNRVQLGGINAATTASAASNAVTALSTGTLVQKEFLLDGIGWAIAKSVVSSMVRSLIDWINSGFEGSPAFVADLQGFLLNAADEAIGGFIDELGGIGSFICSPFRLDVQISVAMSYAQSRSNQPAPTCTLTGIIDNIEGFISGSFSEGGWNDWFDITAQPEVYTPYGAVLTAQAEAQARIINAQGEELTLLDWGDGFLSGETCQEVADGDGESLSCIISKPGKVIQEALTFNLETGPRSLIEADEINEVIAALLGQLAQKAVTGINGLLGLSAGTGYSYSDYDGSFLDEMVDQSQDLISSSTINLPEVMADALAVQEEFQLEAVAYLPELEAASNSIAFLTRPLERERAAEAYEFAEEVITTTTNTIPILTNLVDEATEPDVTVEELNELYNNYVALDLYSEQEMLATIAAWDAIIDSAEGEN